MNIDRRSIVRRVLAVVGFLILIPVVALGALWVSARSSDGPSVIFAGGELVSGDLVTGPEPDWSFVRRRRKYYSLEPAGAVELSRSVDVMHTMSKGLLPKLAAMFGGESR